MASPTAFNTIHDYLVAQWGSTSPLVFENETFPKPNTPAPFLYVELFGSLYDQASLGGGDPVEGNLWRETGHLYGHVLIPNGTGSLAGRQLCQQFLDLFRGHDIGTVNFTGGSIGAGMPGSEDGNYFRMTATLDWVRDE